MNEYIYIIFSHTHIKHTSNNSICIYNNHSHKQKYVRMNIVIYIYIYIYNTITLISLLLIQKKEGTRMQRVNAISILNFAYGSLCVCTHGFQKLFL